MKFYISLFLLLFFIYEITADVTELCIYGKPIVGTPAKNLSKKITKFEIYADDGELIYQDFGPFVTHDYTLLFSYDIEHVGMVYRWSELSDSLDNQFRRMVEAHPEYNKYKFILDP